jgi:predicted ATPase/class 3 adenylate cyclase
VSARMRLPTGLVTFLFTDIEGSTRLAQLLGARYHALLTRHRRVLRSAVAASGGVELFSEGDSLFVAFADAAGALAACARAQRDLARQDWPGQHAPKVRMGLHSGYAEPRGGEYASHEVHRAARIASAAHGGQVLCSAATARLVAGALHDGLCLRNLGLFLLRGFDGRERLYQLVAPGLAERFPRPRGALAAAHNLPAAVTGFVGREPEQRQLRARIEQRRLVSVVGPPGVGKTRLAVRVAARLVGRFPDGVWYVDLTPAAADEAATGEAATIAAAAGGAATVGSTADATVGSTTDAAVAEALGVRPEPGRPLASTLGEHLAGRRLLLVLDSCDAHPVAAAALAVRLLRAAAGVRVMAIGRQPLSLPGELVWRIPPLDRSTALALLADRAAAARGGRPVQPGELPELARVAAALDGLPLALELAATRLRVLSAAQLAARMHDPLAVLDAMEAALDRSYRTLAPAPAELLRKLSVHVAPVRLATVEFVHRGDPLDPLAALVDRSLVQVDGTTYRMLGPVRAFAARRLRAAGEEPAARDRHVAWCRAVAAHADVGPDGRPGAGPLDALDPLADELRAALRWTVAGGSARAGLALARILGRWWRDRGLAVGGGRWLDRLYARLDATGEPVPDAELAAAYALSASLAAAAGDTAAEQAYAARAEELARRGAPVLPQQAWPAKPGSELVGTIRVSGCNSTSGPRSSGWRSVSGARQKLSGPAGRRPY